MILRSLMLAALAAIAPPAAKAHMADSGVMYPDECCNGRDCYEIEPTDLAPVDGGYMIKATGEVWPMSAVKDLHDGRYHRCSAAGAIGATTYCLYAPPMGM